MRVYRKSDLDLHLASTPLPLAEGQVSRGLKSVATVSEIKIHPRSCGRLVRSEQSTWVASEWTRREACYTLQSTRHGLLEQANHGSVSDKHHRPWSGGGAQPRVRISYEHVVLRWIFIVE